MIDKKRLDLEKNALGGAKGLAAYEAIFHMVFTDLVRFALSIVHSIVLAEEVVSDVLIRIWEKRRELGTVEDFRLYLFASTRNRAINYLKSKKLGLTENVDQQVVDWDNCTPQLKSKDLDPEALIEFAELNQKVAAAIEGLPAKCKLIYQLVKEDGLKYKEVASLLGISVKTVENQMTIAFKKLHEQLD
ncbi:RNA polymerase sigma-70 factor [Arachidicoccus rhizosphaerae]|nr:RNA polymerase sigma-70 factor [Arachidicoccus rhizosphaerae]